MLRVGGSAAAEFFLVPDVESDGFQLEVRQDGETRWTTSGGPVELRTVSRDDELREPVRVPYDDVRDDGNQVVATASARTAEGTRVEVTDRMTVSGGQLRVRRESTIVAVGEDDRGYLTTFALRSSEPAEPENFEWFAPSSWYGNDDDNFRSRSKLAYQGGEVAYAIDSTSAPLLSAYDPGSASALVVSDASPGRRGTVVADEEPRETKIIVDDRLELPGLGMRRAEEDGRAHTEVFSSFPGWTTNFRGLYGPATVWRFLPLDAGRTDVSGSAVKVTAASTFARAIRDIWRAASMDADGRPRAEDRSVDPLTAATAIAEWVDRSWVVNDQGYAAYGGTYARPRAESGFLWRAADLAALMIEIGHEQGNTGYLDRARRVVEDQIRLDIGNSDDMNRVRVEGLQAILRAYQAERAAGAERADWLAYVVDETDDLVELVNAEGNFPFFASRPDDFSRNAGHVIVPLLFDVQRATGTTAYTEVAVRAGTFSWENGHNAQRYTGALVDYAGGPVEIDRETGYLALDAYLDLHSLTGERVWLDRAEAAATFAETWQVVQDVDLTRAGDVGGSVDDMSLGNDTLDAAGYSVVHAGTTGVDVFGALHAPDFVDLAARTGDAHYQRFAETVLRSAVQYVDIGDKSGAMADFRFGSGRGVQNEAMALGLIDYGPLAGRGRGLTWPIQWVGYQLLRPLRELQAGELGDPGRRVLATSLQEVVDDASPRTAFGPGWTRATESGAFDGTLSTSATAASAGELSFTGTQVAWYGPRSPLGGRAEVYLDGVLQDVVDTGAAEERQQVALWRSTRLAYGSHQLRIVTVADDEGVVGPVSIDRFEVDSNQVDAPSRQIGTDPVIGYQGNWRPDVGGGVMRTREPGAEFRLSFTGPRVAWYADAGPLTGSVEVFLDGASRGVVDLSRTAGTERSRAGARSRPVLDISGLTRGEHELRVVVREARGRGVSVASLESASSDVVTRDQTDPGVALVGSGWRTVDDPTAYDGSVVRAGREDSAAEVVVGSSAALHGPRSTGGGSLRVLVDGEQVATVSTQGAPNATQPLWTSDDLGAGRHLLRIEVVGDGPVAVDAITESAARSIPLRNPGFETGSLAGWRGTGIAFAEQAAQYVRVRAGVWKATLASATTTDAGEVVQTVGGLDAGATYRVSGYLQSGNRPAILFARAGDEVVEVEHTIGNASRDGWFAKDLLVTLPDDVTSLQLGLRTPAQPAFTYAALDEVVLERVG